MTSSITSASNFSNLQAGVVAMVNNWNQVASQNDAGPTFELLLGSTTECQVNVKTDSNVSSGATWTFTADSGGYVTGGTIGVNPNDAASVSGDVAKYVFTHELGHGEGLGDVTPSADCSQTGTIMMGVIDTTENFACTPTACDKAAQNDVYNPPPPPPPPPPSGCVTDDDCTCGGSCMWSTGDCIFTYDCSPIIIAVGTSADYQLTSAEDGVRFDMDASGIAQRVAWTRADDPVAFLVLDRNHNGIVDNGSELFGNHTRLPDGSLAPNGFYALAALDLPENGGNSDGGVDSSDSIWTELQLWIDWNHNGFSEPGELYRPGDFGLTTISIDYRETNRSDAFGNMFRLTAPCQLGNKIRFGYDVYFSAKPQRRP